MRKDPVGQDRGKVQIICQIMRGETMSWKLKIYCFDNDMIAVFDTNEQQVPDLQGPKEKALPKIIEWLEARR